MKNTLYYISFALFLVACGQKTTDKNQELLELKKQKAALDLKIATLEEEASKNDTSKATAVSIYNLNLQDFNSFVDVQAEITGEENVMAVPQTMQPAVVKEILVTPGMNVKKGQVLATLDASTIDQQIQGVDAQLILAKQLYEKQQKLFAQNIGSQVQLLQLKTQYEATESNKKALIAMKSQFKIFSPINGVVDMVNLKVGDVASAASGQAKMGIRVVSKDKLKSVAILGENYVGKVNQGDVVELIFPDLNDSIKTTVSYVSQAIDPITRAFNVEVKLANNNKLRPNMSCKMKITNYTKKNSICIPVAAIQNTSEGSLVYVAEGNVAKATLIKTGKNANGIVEVLDGLKEGQKLIVAGFEDLENNERITIK